MGHATATLDTEGVLEGFVSICRVCWSVRVSAYRPVCVLERCFTWRGERLQNTGGSFTRYASQKMTFESPLRTLIPALLDSTDANRVMEAPGPCPPNTDHHEAIFVTILSRNDC